VIVMFPVNWQNRFTQETGVEIKTFPFEKQVPLGVDVEANAYPVTKFAPKGLMAGNASCTSMNSKIRVATNRSVWGIDLLAV